MRLSVTLSLPLSGKDKTDDLPNNNRRPRIDTICAAFVTYHPGPGFASRVAKIVPQVGAVVIVDNHSGEPLTRELVDLCGSTNATLIQNSENRGIAAALNQAARWARQRHFDWLLTLDQDTTATDDMVAALISVYEDFPVKEELAVIGSNYKDARNGRLFLPSDRNGDCSWQEAKTPITAGSLFSLACFSVVGPFREEFFIDCVDWEYCLRARALGLRIVMARRPLMQHPIGSSSTHHFLWKVTQTSNHVPVRRYYMMRNHLVLAREYVLKEPKWVFSTLQRYLKSILVACLFEKDRFAKLKFLVMGIVDGLCCNFKRKLPQP